MARSNFGLPDSVELMRRPNETKAEEGRKGKGGRRRRVRCTAAAEERGLV